MDCRRCFLPEVNESFPDLWCLLMEIKYKTDFNFSLNEAWWILQEYQNHDRNVTHTTEVVLIFVYSCLIIAGLSANLIVSWVVARKAQMHTARNLFIVNLTLSDMTLCVICMPFTLLSIIQRHWGLGLVLCKLVPSLQGANILVSVGTITVIALDRYCTIVRGHDARCSRRRAIASIASVWTVAALAVTPVFYFQSLVPVGFQHLVLYDMCLEQWPSQQAKVSYACALLLVQAVIPVLVVGVMHSRIARHLHAHASTQRDHRRLAREIERNRRTTILLSVVAILFALSWLPLGLFSLLADVLFPPESPAQISPQSLYVGFAICHVIAMSSAVSNPVVYGWLNSNIRQEFVQLLQSKCGASGEEAADRAPGLMGPMITPTPVTKTASAVTTQTVTEAVARTGPSYRLATAYHSAIKPRGTPFTIDVLV